MSYSGITQAEFIAILFAYCGYDTSAQRRGWLQKRFGKSYADELTVTEASRAALRGSTPERSVWWG
jgi:hypothetical protein